MTDLRNHDWSSDPIFDSAMMRHGFTTYMRDYDVVVELPALRPDGDGSYIEARYRYRFTHCVEAIVKTKLRPDLWRQSWSDAFIDFAAWEKAGEPSGLVWGVECAEAYPGVEYVERSGSAGAWTEQVGKPMHAIRIETNAYVIELVCHDLLVARLAVGDPHTGDRKPID
jgi:hypothetical protein